MDKALKALWVEALRSGKYKQGKGSLRATGNKYCCLGVLADQVCPLNWTKYDDTCMQWSAETDYRDGDGDYAYLPHFMVSEAKQRVLSQMNDGEDMTGNTIPPKSFEEIADYIEKHL